MQTITIRRGIAGEQESLCRSCYWAHIQRGFRESEEVVHCCFSRFRAIPFKVAECSDFSQKNLPIRREMEDIALIIPTNPARRATGFSSESVEDETDESVYQITE